MKTNDSLFFNNDCGLIKPRIKSGTAIPYVYTIPIHLRVNNEKVVYSILGLSKRGRRHYLYIKILENNVCIEKGRVVELFFSSGNSLVLVNNYAVNCEGNYVRNLTKQEVRILAGEDISSIVVYSFRKNYEHYLNNAQRMNFQNQLNCLLNYKMN